MITPRVIECGDLIDCSFNELTIKVYVTGHSEKDDFQILQVKYKTSPKPCDSLELKIQNMVIYAEYNQVIYHASLFKRSCSIHLNDYILFFVRATGMKALVC